MAEHPRVKLTLDVPAKLGEGLDAGRLDAALAPVFDYLCAGAHWRLVPDGCIASDGETLTVRVFSRVPVERITRLAVDADSRTSVALARIILSRRFGLSPRFEPAAMNDLLSRPAADQPDSMLLIGDKVVRAGPNDPRSGWPYQLDLGSAWRAWTGLPFVFAVWAARADGDLGDLPDLLAEAKDRGLVRRRQIARDEAAAHGWPVELATEYLTRHLEYELTPRHLEAMERFLQLACDEGIIPKEDPEPRIRPDEHG